MGDPQILELKKRAREMGLRVIVNRATDRNSPFFGRLMLLCPEIRTAVGTSPFGLFPEEVDSMLAEFEGGCRKAWRAAELGIWRRPVSDLALQSLDLAP